jgi:rhamnosyl/mannosyltransferase
MLHLGKYYPPAPGGIESHVQTLARGQANLGHDVTVLCVNHADQGGKDITHSRWKKTTSFTQMDGKIRVERVGRWFGLSRLEVCPGLIGRLRKATGQADVVHLHTPNPLMLAAWWLAGNRETPLVVTHHSDVIKQKVLQRLVDPIEARVYGAAKLILSDSPNYMDGSAILHKHRLKVDVLPLGIDLDRLLNPGIVEVHEANRLKQAYGYPLWLMVGRMTYYKGYHVAIKALAETRGKLVVVGNGPLETELRGQAQELGVADRIVWMSAVLKSQLVSLYHAATALWFPSVARSEGFGLVQVEAMASGCPVINTDIPGSGVSWVSQDMVSGLTVKVGDAEQMASAATKIGDDESLRQKLADGALERAKKYFDAKTMVCRSIDFYKMVCK